MTEDWTCGQGLAKNAEVPARLADLASSMAGLLEAHTRALDVSNEGAARTW
jgi:hypothetical protein